MGPWRFVRCESWPCSDYETERNLWLYVMEIARDIKNGSLGDGKEIIRIRTRRGCGTIAELHQQAMGTVGDNPAPYFLTLRCDQMKRQVKKFFADWIRPK
jgi:hypothetical protein